MTAKQGVSGGAASSLVHTNIKPKNMASQRVGYHARTTGIQSDGKGVGVSGERYREVSYKTSGVGIRISSRRSRWGEMKKVIRQLGAGE